MVSKLALVRKEKKVSQTAMAEKAGLTQSLISQIEGRKLVPGARHRRRIAQAYGLAGRETEYFDPKTGLAI